MKREHLIARVAAILGAFFLSTVVVFTQSATSEGQDHSHHPAAGFQSMPSPIAGAQGMGKMSGQGVTGGKQTTPRVGNLAAGKASFTTFCASCHGHSGKGDGPAGATLRTRPRDFTDCAKMTPMADAMLFNVVKDGGAASSLSGDMPSWKDAFEDREIRDLVAYVRLFCKK